MTGSVPSVIPGTYNGLVTINGQMVPDGTVIAASIGRLEWGRAITSAGRYIMDIPSGPTYPIRFEGGTVWFRSGGLTAREQVTWRSGLQDVDLTFHGSIAQLETSWDSSRAYAGVQALRDLYARVPPTTKGVAPPEGMIVRPVFRGREFAVDESLCFVLMPFDNELAPVYQDHIRTAVESQGLTCMRADELFSPGQVMEQIWEQMNRAGLIIVDLTGKNPNVFYELGIVHALGKPVILMTQSEDDVPFDLRHLRFIKYEYTPHGCHQLEQDLRRAVQSVLHGRSW